METPTVSLPGPILRECHRLLKHARELQTRIEQAPKTLKAHQARTRKQEDALHQAQDDLKKLKANTLDKESQVKTKRQQIAKYEKQLDDIANKKEYDALQHEIAGANAAISQLEDEILAAMEEADQRAAALPELEKATKQAQADLTEFERGNAERVAALVAQRQQALAELALVEPTLPQDLKQVYERQVRGKGDDGLSGVQAGSCLTCYTEVTAQNFNELKKGRCLTCNSCGRLLYSAE